MTPSTTGSACAIASRTVGETRFGWAFARLLCGGLAVAACSSPTTIAAPSAATAEVAPDFTTHFTANFAADRPSALASIRIEQADDDVREIDLNAPPARYELVSADGEAKHAKGRIVWSVPDAGGTLTYRVQIEHKRRNGRRDAMHAGDWAIMRLGHLFPRATTRIKKRSSGRASLTLEGPGDWSFQTRWGRLKNGAAFAVPSTPRTFDRPSGWLAAGKLGTRRAYIDGRQILVTSPRGSGMRRMDLLTFLHWTVPELARTFPGLPRSVMILGAPDGMWRGGLSAPGSLYMQIDRPVVSENRTSTVLHELIHLAGFHSAAPGADWIVEGIPEYYSLLLIRRSGGMTQQRFAQSLATIEAWADAEGAQLKDPSKGAHTARAAILFHELAGELRGAGHNIDELVARLLAADALSVANLEAALEDLLGAPSPTLAAYLKAANEAH